MQGIAPAFFRDWTATLQMQVRVDIYFRTATPDTQVKFERGHRKAEKQKNKEKERLVLAFPIKGAYNVCK